MSRYDRHRKEQTRARIVERAGRRMKKDGIDGSGISVLMQDADLTNGAFYAHFSSKTNLVATVVDDQLTTQRATLEAMPHTPEALEEFIDWYVSTEHRDDPQDGCPSAALLTDIGRSDAVVRETYTTGLAALIDLLADRLPGADAAESHSRAVGLTALLFGTLQMARAVSDPTMSETVLRSGRAQARRFLE